MKKLIITSILFMLVSLGALNTIQAQDKEITKDRIPQQVIIAIQTDFPSWDIEKTKWYMDSKTFQEWAPVDENLNRYVVEANGRNYKIHAVYDDTGKLLYSKTSLKDVALPLAITRKLASDEEFKGWQITGDHEVIKNFKEDSKVYTVHLQKDGDKKTVHFNRMGEKVRRPLIGE